MPIASIQAMASSTRCSGPLSVFCPAAETGLVRAVTTGTGSTTGVGLPARLRVTARGAWWRSARAARAGRGRGSTDCWRDARSTSSWRRSRTSWRASPGHCSAAGRTTAPRRREYGFGKGRPPRARAGRPLPEGLPRAAGAVVEDGVSGRTGIGGARDSPRAEQPVVMTGSRSAELIGAGGRGPPRPDGWRQPRPERRTRQNPCGAGGVHGWQKRADGRDQGQEDPGLLLRRTRRAAGRADDRGSPAPAFAEGHSPIPRPRLASTREDAPERGTRTAPSRPTRGP